MRSGAEMPHGCATSSADSTIRTMAPISLCKEYGSSLLNTQPMLPCTWVLLERPWWVIVFSWNLRLISPAGQNFGKSKQAIESR